MGSEALAFYLFGAVAMVATRCVDVDQAYRAVDVRIFVMIAGVIPLGIAIAVVIIPNLVRHGAFIGGVWCESPTERIAADIRASTGGAMNSASHQHQRTRQAVSP